MSIAQDPKFFFGILIGVASVFVFDYALYFVSGWRLRFLEKAADDLTEMADEKAKELFERNHD